MSSTLKLELGRRYRFSASHRLHSAHLSEEENNRIFGKCNNPYGHGHNYVVEVSVSGDLDPATGMIANLADLDAFVQHQVLDAQISPDQSCKINAVQLSRNRHEDADDFVAMKSSPFNTLQHP